MKTKLLTEMELRARWLKSPEPVCYVDEGTILTPAAKDFVLEHGIDLRFGQNASGMTVKPIPSHGGQAYYTEAGTGLQRQDKPEEMTHLHGNVLVYKNHPRIAFRGKLDSLMAQILSVQVMAAQEGCSRLCDELEELLSYVRNILAAEVKEQPLEIRTLLAMDAAEIRRVSHHVKEAFGIDHPVPNHRMGSLCMALNLLRTQVRETELAAANAFLDAHGACARGDILQALNRLSSCVYILFCRKLTGFYEGEGRR